MFCTNCGKEISDNAVVCLSCGAAGPATTVPTGTSPLQTGQKSKIAAGIMGILLGGLGVHRFYLGYVGIGIAQIVVTMITCGIGSIWGLIEGILILTGTINRDASGKPLRD